MENKKKLHGNNARIDAGKEVIPRFTNYAVNNYKASDNILEENAEFCRNEVNDNKK